MTEKSRSRLLPDYFTGCLLAGAVGDALGASIEFMSMDQIRHAHGESGYLPGRICLRSLVISNLDVV